MLTALAMFAGIAWVCTTGSWMAAHLSDKDEPNSRIVGRAITLTIIACCVSGLWAMIREVMLQQSAQAEFGVFVAGLLLWAATRYLPEQREDVE